MKNSKITRKITPGMYVLTTPNGGCMVDAVSQVSAGDNPLISVAVMKKNFTNECMNNGKIFALSVLGEEVNPEIIKTFGFNSMRDINKFEKVKTTEVMGVKVVNDSLGYIICEIVDKIENDTHTLFIGKMIEGDVTNDKSPMSYGYYQEHKDELLKVTTTNGQTAWVCTICGYVYYGEMLPDGFLCPICKMDASHFEKKN